MAVTDPSTHTDPFSSSGPGYFLTSSGPLFSYELRRTEYLINMVVDIMTIFLAAWVEQQLLRYHTT